LWKIEMATLRRNESENGTERERGFALGCPAKLDSSGIVLQWNGKVEEDVAFYISRGRSGEVEDVVVS
jgi:hypothetical protein